METSVFEAQKDTKFLSRDLKIMAKSEVKSPVASIYDLCNSCFEDLLVKDKE